ncbi:right-handed parallel beta-helix repeat-containing protein [Clostridium sp. SHJSY1]|uniref:right-handed parallel beta-helix repeat-containing protein n=1 Tax=Clostridium sp. SHJSY1 TaxID=2942483 RepID=UPI002874DB94|nr:right-handed parallel beta-helix repeat-containing protein [Clostridium sp. SHJSY1]MDS0524671.1 right-handed parallel beta-helix repeat-containing protein [Clostridium sp. SHJSY1]
MKKIKLFCLGVAMVASVATVSSLGTIDAKAATTITVNAGGNLSSALSKAKNGDTILVNGTVKSGSLNIPAGITLKGNGKMAKIDFAGTKTGARGLTVNTNGSTIQDLEICNAGDNGIYVQGSSNKFINLNVHDNGDAGVQISNGGANNYLKKVYSHNNADVPTKGENADGFAIKLHSGVGNVLEDCVAENNTDDGYDLYAAHGAVTFINCQANNNGATIKGVSGDGNGFKLGGADNKTPGQAAHLDPWAHKLTNCSAKGNKKNGFDRNNQNGVVTMDGCTGDSNRGLNYNWPKTIKPSALGGKTIVCPNVIIKNSKSINGKNNISGATVTNSPTIK